MNFRVFIKKKITRKIFNKKINFLDERDDKFGRYESLNFIKKKDLVKYLKKKSYDFEDHKDIYRSFLNRSSVKNRNDFLGKILKIIKEFKIGYIVFHLFSIVAFVGEARFITKLFSMSCQSISLGSLQKRKGSE